MKTPAGIIWQAFSFPGILNTVILLSGDTPVANGWKDKKNNNLNNRVLDI